MIIQHNISALNAYRQLGTNNSVVAKNLEKLSSGYKINKAGDDAAGLAISEKMRSQVKGLETAKKNANDGISLIQTAEGSLTEVHSMLNRMVELATQASNGTYTDSDRAKLQSEVESLSTEIDRIAESTNFNGIKLLDGSMGVGSTGATITTTASGSVAAFEYSLTGVEKGVSATFTASATAGVSASWVDDKLTITIGSAAAGKITQKMIDQAIASASDTPANAKNAKITLKKDIDITGATANGVIADSTATAAEAKKATAVYASVGTSTGGNTTVTVTNGVAGAKTPTITTSNTAANKEGATVGIDGNIALNLDAAKEYSAQDLNQLMSAAGSGITYDFEDKLTGADVLGISGGTMTLGTEGVAGSGATIAGGLNLQVGETNDAYQKVSVKVGNMNTTSLGIGSINIGTEDGASAAITKINEAINSVSTTRSDLGALQNRLEHTISNLGVTTENMTAAESRIRDVDMAKEMMDYTKNNIITQAAQAMLAQANQLPQGVLQLLR